MLRLTSPLMRCGVRLPAVYARFVSSSMVWGSNTKGQIVRLIMGISLLLLTFASAMFTVESVHPFDSDVPSAKQAVLSFWKYLYFGAVTMSTGTNIAFVRALHYI